MSAASTRDPPRAPQPPSRMGAGPVAAPHRRRDRHGTGLLDAATWRDLTEVWDWSLEFADDPDLKSHPDGTVMIGLAATSAWFRGELDTRRETRLRRPRPGRRRRMGLPRRHLPRRSQPWPSRPRPHARDHRRRNGAATDTELRCRCPRGRLQRRPRQRPGPQRAVLVDRRLPDLRRLPPLHHRGNRRSRRSARRSPRPLWRSHRAGDDRRVNLRPRARVSWAPLQPRRRRRNEPSTLRLRRAHRVLGANRVLGAAVGHATQPRRPPCLDRRQRNRRPPPRRSRPRRRRADPRPAATARHPPRRQSDIGRSTTGVMLSESLVRRSPGTSQPSHHDDGVPPSPSPSPP